MGIQRNFEAIILRVPNGSQLVMLFGEIDCREGFHVAVAKDRYEVGGVNFKYLHTRNKCFFIVF